MISKFGNKNISFIMPVFNCQDTIEESVESIFQGNFTKGDEVIIVDDASTDNTLKVIKKLLKNTTTSVYSDITTIKALLLREGILELIIQKMN